MRRALYAIGWRAAAALESIARACEEGARRLRRCPDCGRSTFYGRPCK